MNTVNIDTERLVRDFLAAVDSLKKPNAELPCASSPEREPEPESCPVPAVDPTEPASLSDFLESSEDSDAEDCDAGQHQQHRVFEEFASDHELHERLKVTPQELETLSGSSLFGALSSKTDLLFILRQIREGAKSDHANQDGFKPRSAPDQVIEESPRNFKEMTERIRREAMARIEKLPPKAASSWSHIWKRPRAKLA
ncbi:MAG: hypothetical protein WAU33_11665 [Candidatus Binataceae bacterium]